MSPVDVPGAKMPVKGDVSHTFMLTCTRQLASGGYLASPIGFEEPLNLLPHAWERRRVGVCNNLPPYLRHLGLMNLVLETLVENP